MIATQFPELGWLKARIAENFRSRRGLGNLQLDTEGFPSVVINAKSKETFRPDIAGPLSVFINLQGQSRCKVDGRTVVVGEDNYFISNRHQPYTLEIENNATTETFNIHIGEYFSEQFFAGVMQSSDTLLNQGKQLNIPTIAFHNQLYRRDAVFDALVNEIRSARQEAGFDKLLFEEKLAGLLFYLLQQHRGILRQIQSIPPLKQATRIELYKRLSLGADYIQSAYNSAIDLDAIASAACLSKFHFLRLFRLAYGVSPYQCLQQLRISRAENLLKHSSASIADIALQLGFENSNSFSRLFRQHRGVYPSQYRLAVN
ncbi:MAG: helix-turn-helix transcriptional regulator [Chitinophagaceae bacterium]|nr:helix-turn-helix transcriptional regulator [Chitinophagaceae bacterium]